MSCFGGIEEAETQLTRSVVKGIHANHKKMKLSKMTFWVLPKFGF